MWQKLEVSLLCRNLVGKSPRTEPDIVSSSDLSCTVAVVGRSIGGGAGGGAVAPHLQTRGQTVSDASRFADLVE